MNLKNKTKQELIQIIKTLEKDIEYMNEELFTENQLNERYDQGYDFGYQKGQEDSVPQELDEEELSEFDNVIRFG